MKKITLVSLVILFLSAGVAAAYAGDSEALEKAMVKIFTVTNTPDYSQPWQMLGQGGMNGSGCVIEGYRILTNAHVVSNQTFIQVLKYGDTQKYVAKVEYVDHDCDLAILTVPDRDFFNGTVPVGIGKVPNMGDTVKVYGFPVGGEKLSITEGVVSRIEISKYSHSYREFLTVQIDAAINPGNSGGPVINNNRLVGVAFQGLNNSQSIGYAIPPVMVNHFLRDIKGKKYEGFPSLGVETQNLENESYRQKLGMAKKQTGVIVNAVCYGSSAWGVIKEGDVIMSIDGVKIENDGTVPYGSKGRLDMSFITDLKYVGDEVNINVLRDKKPVKLAVVMKKEELIVPLFQYDIKPTYYIFGGFVFTNLTVNYISRLWDKNDSRPEILDRVMYDIATPEKQQVIIIRQVLADESNKGYHDFRDIIVEKVNGQPISGMKDLIQKIAVTKGAYLEIGLENRDNIILDIEKSRKASAEILSRYKIPVDRSDDLKEPGQIPEVPLPGVKNLK